MSTGLVEHFFRHEYGRLVATLSRRVGVQHIEAVEDAVQSALMSALESWTHAGLPNEPSAWLFRVAHNELIGALRTGAARRRSLAARPTSDVAPPPPAPRLSREVDDDLLRMLFVCCDDAISIDAQLVLALKTLCGFSVREISLRVFTNEATVYKRLARARQRLSEPPSGVERFTAPLAPSEYASRRPAVLRILYVMFTEGYLSSHAELAIRRELSEEAMRLATLLAQHATLRSPESAALLALMHLHFARFAARQDASGGLLLLEEQDRRQFDREHVRVGLEWLARSAEGDVFSRYHAEAGIAAEHCLAPSFQETRWDRVAESYALLEQASPSLLHRLNRAVAVAEWQGPAAGLEVLAGLEPPSWLAGSHLWSAVLADLHGRVGDAERAERHTRIALDTAPTPAVRSLLKRRLSRNEAKPTGANRQEIENETHEV